MTTYISDIEHYNSVLSRVANVKHSLVIGTADIKDLYVSIGGNSQPFLAVLDSLVRRGVEVRLIHAKERTLKRLLCIYLMWYKFTHSGCKDTQNYANRSMMAGIKKKPINLCDWLFTVED